MKLLVVDANSIVNRAFYGIRPLTTKDGQFTNAIYGFMTMLEKIKADTSPDAVAIAFDLKAPTFRHKAYSGYKAKRKGMPYELLSQIEPLKELLTSLGYKIVSCEGYEADDILGTLAKECEKSGNTCVIATGDRDSLQLVSEQVSVRLAKNVNGAMMYTPTEIMQEYKVEPKKLIEIKAIQGDASDNIPGVAGIGPKGAGELIEKFGSVAYIYEHLDTIDIKDTVRKKLTDSKDNAILSRMLGEIFCDVPIDRDIQNYIVTAGDKAKAKQLMVSFELFSLMSKLDLEDVPTVSQAVTEQKSVEVVIVDDNSISELLQCENELVMYAYFNASDMTRIVLTEQERLLIIDEKDLIDRLLKCDNEKVVYSSKELYAYADKNGFELNNIVFDMSLAAYLLNPSASSYSVERLCEEYGVQPFALDQQYDDYGAVCCMPELYKKLSKRIVDFSLDKLLSEMEIPLANVLAKMENIGFLVDTAGIEKYGEDIASQLNQIEQSIYEQVGYEFNINSPKQLAQALFEKLGLPAKKKTKSGYSTNADVLESLVNYHPVISMILSFRTLSKLKSTYCDSLVKVADENGRIHSSFNQTETRTGRISSTEPNLQNIPVRTELGKELRRFFTAKSNCVLVDADYSQIELRVLAHIADDKNMKQAFIDNTDIHAVTASQVFNIPLDMVSPIMRSRAKAVNFGIVYGIGAFSLSKDIGVSHKEASNYIKNYLAHYSGIDLYMNNIIEKAKADGYVETIFGRRRYLPELSASNHMTRAFGERVARNAPIQGTAADIIKIAMVRVDSRLKKEGLLSRLILQVHDELIVEAPENEAMYVAMLLQEEMENAVKLSVPLVAQASVGKTWYEAKE